MQSNESTTHVDIDNEIVQLVTAAGKITGSSVCDAMTKVRGLGRTNTFSRLRRLYVSKVLDRSGTPQGFTYFLRGNAEQDSSGNEDSQEASPRSSRPSNPSRRSRRSKHVKLQRNRTRSNSNPSATKETLKGLLDVTRKITRMELAMEELKNVESNLRAQLEGCCK